jgi:hypothetical protein
MRTANRTADTSIRVDKATRDRLAALGELIGKPTRDAVELVSYADLQMVLQCTARQGAAEVVASKGAKS